MIKGATMQRGGHDSVQFLCCKIFLFRLRMRRFITHKRKRCNDTVRNRFSDNCFQPYSKIYNRSWSLMTFRTQMQIEFFNERTV